MSALGKCLHPDWCGGTDLCRNCCVPLSTGPKNNCDRGCCSIEPWAARFAVLLECRYCFVLFELENPDPAKEFAPYVQGQTGSNRLVLLGAPDRCPQCRNEGVRPRPKNVVDFKGRRPEG